MLILFIFENTTTKTNKISDRSLRALLTRTRGLVHLSASCVHMTIQTLLAVTSTTDQRVSIELSSKYNYLLHQPLISTTTQIQLISSIKLFLLYKKETVVGYSIYCYVF